MMSPSPLHGSNLNREANASRVPFQGTSPQTLVGSAMSQTQLHVQFVQPLTCWRRLSFESETFLLLFFLGNGVFGIQTASDLMTGPFPNEGSDFPVNFLLLYNF